ncbi:hypothetical protein [Brachybacterium sp. UNK5269]|uniref:hypothetical protein n=1 Tax=Brachybacterium sp. UNK5269 TaxID=3408576 RepID=UPI003BB07009
MSETPESPADDQHTDVEELSDEGVGGTVGSKDTFEPEESESPEAESAGSPEQ